MKTKELTCVGHCGIQIELNLMDQYELTHTVDRINAYFDRKRAWEDYRERRNHERPWNDKDAGAKWDAENPEPECPKPTNCDEELQILGIFLRKIILKDVQKSTIFDEEDEK